MKVVHKLGLVSLAAMLAAASYLIPAFATPGQGKLFGTDGSAGNLYSIDPATAAATLIGNMGFAAPALAMDPTTGILYAGRGGGSPQLYTVDPNTGAAVLVGDTGFGFAAVPGLDFNSDGVLYAAANVIDDGGTGGDSLATIDKTTGLGTIIGPFGGGIGTFGGPGGIETVAFNAAGTLYGASGTQSATAGVPSLYTINPGTGAATLVAPIVDAAGVPPAGGVVSLQFGCDGTLYGGTGGGNGNLVTIDPATGAFTLIGDSVTGSLGGLAFEKPCGVAPPAGCKAIQIGGPLGWTTKTPIPTGVEGATGVIIGDRIYVTHGYIGFDSTLNQIYDIPTDSWSLGASAAVSRSELTGVCIEDPSGQGLVFAVGGRFSGPLSEVEIYNPATDTWFFAPPMPTPRRGLGAAFVPGIGVAGGNLGSVFVVGGSDGTAPHSGAPLSVNEAFDVAAGVWVPRASMPIPMMDIYSTTYFPATGRIYVIGGFDGTSVSTTVQIYDPVSDAWTLGAPMPTPRSNLISGICGERIYAIGGFDDFLGNLNVNQSYDPFTNSWSPLEPTKPTPSSEMASQFIYTGAEIFAIGSGIFGAAAAFNEVFTCEVCPPSTIVISLPDSASGLPGTNVTVPLSLTDVTGQGVLSADVVVQFDATVINAVGVTPGSLTGSCTLTSNLPAPGTLAISVFCTAPLSGAGSLADITFNVVGTLGQISPLDIATATLNEGTPPVCADDGAFMIPSTANITGAIVYYRDEVTGAEPSTKLVDGANVSLSGFISAGSVTDCSGFYAFTGLPLLQSYTVFAQKSDDFNGGIDPFDAALNAQDVVGLITLSPNQLLAADVSGNGNNTSFDSALMAQFAVGLISAFPVAALNGSDWTFVPMPQPEPNQVVANPIPPGGIPGSVSFVPLVESAEDQKFLAILYGDVSGNWQPVCPPIGASVATLSASASEKAAETSRLGVPGGRLELPTLTATAGEVIRVPIRAVGTERAISFYLDLRFDPAVLRLLRVVTGSAASRFSLTSNTGHAGRARMALFDSKPLGAEGVVAVVEFQVVGRPGDRTTLSLPVVTVNEGAIRVNVREGSVLVRRGR